MTYLNHGSFGACPKPVFNQYQHWQKELERQPIQFLTDTVYHELRNARDKLGNFVGCAEDELIFFENPTTAVTNVIHNLDLSPGDEILTTDHEYGALVRAWKAWCSRSGATLIEQPIPMPLENTSDFMESFWKGVTPKTKVIFISEITSSTGLIFPINEIIYRAKESNILTIVDGAHVPAHIPLNIHELGCDFYTGACHKWLCGPKGVSFLFVKKEHQSWMKPVVYSWGKDGADPGPTEFLQDFNWQGTRDMSAFLTIPHAIQFFQDHIEPEQNRCQNAIQKAYYQFTQELKTDPISSGGDWIGQMVSHPIQTNKPAQLKMELWEKYKIEIPVFEHGGQSFIRISFQVYNSENDVNLLMSALKSLL